MKKKSLKEVEKKKAKMKEINKFLKESLEKKNKQVKESSLRLEN